MAVTGRPWYPSRGRAAEMCRTGAPVPSGRTATPATGRVSASPGITATPRPAATSACTAIESSVMKRSRA